MVESRRVSSLPRSPNPLPTAARPSAVLIDGSALYLAARALHEGRQLDYHGFVGVLTTELPQLKVLGTNTQTRWVMWTSASPQNVGQSRFLDFAENELQWEVRRFNPADSFVVEPSTILDVSQATRARLVRFDAGIAFAIGRLAETHLIVVVSDSFALAQPLVLSRHVAPEQAPPVLAFFGRALDSRWQGVLRRERSTLRFIDLDDHEEALFGSKQVAERRSTRANELIF